VVLDGREVTDRPFELTPGGFENLTITFTDVSAEISGSLMTPAGTPATDYFLILLPADRAYWSASRSRRITSTRPDRAGHYSFPRLPPGDYLVVVTTDLVPEDLRNLNAIERLAAEGVKVSVAVGEKKTFDLRTGAPASASAARMLFRGVTQPASSRR